MRKIMVFLIFALAVMWYGSFERPSAAQDDGQRMVILNAIYNPYPFPPINEETTATVKSHSELLDLIKKFEGFSQNAYLDLDGEVAIGYGLRKKDIPGLKMGDTITEEKATEILSRVLTEYGKVVDESVKVDIKPYQRNALVSFTYNIGPSGFSESSVLKKLNKGDYEGAADSFKLWCNIKRNGEKIKIQGLVNRRLAEKNLFLGESEA